MKLAGGGVAASAVVLTLALKPSYASGRREDIAALARAYRQVHQKSQAVFMQELVASIKHMIEDNQSPPPARIHDDLIAVKMSLLGRIMRHPVTVQLEVYFKYGMMCELFHNEVNGVPSNIEKLMAYGYFEWLDQLDREIADFKAPLRPFWRDYQEPYAAIDGVEVIWSPESGFGVGRFLASNRV